jgi:hypothetical protein
MMPSRQSDFFKIKIYIILRAEFLSNAHFHSGTRGSWIISDYGGSQTGTRILI